MKKSDKMKHLDILIERGNALTYTSENHPQIHLIDDVLSFIRNTVDEKNKIVWDNRIKHLYWGVPKARSLDAEHTRSFRWHSAKESFIGILNSIKQEIEQYTDDNAEYISSTNCITSNEIIIFLSHSSTDKPYGDALEKVITGLGVKNDQLIYTSHPLHKIPLDVNIFEYLRNNINNNIFMIFLLSDTYLDSPSCLNEMGAAWIIQSDYTNIFTPDFSFDNPKFHKCAVDTNKNGIVLNGKEHCRPNMIELKNKIVSLFGLSVDEKHTSFLLDNFIEEIKKINTP